MLMDWMQYLRAYCDPLVIHPFLSQAPLPTRPVQYVPYIVPESPLQHNIFSQSTTKTSEHGFPTNDQSNGYFNGSINCSIAGVRQRLATYENWAILYHKAVAYALWRPGCVGRGVRVCGTIQKPVTRTGSLWLRADITALVPWGLDVAGRPAVCACAELSSNFRHGCGHFPDQDFCRLPRLLISMELKKITWNLNGQMDEDKDKDEWIYSYIWANNHWVTMMMFCFIFHCWYGRRYHGMTSGSSTCPALDSNYFITYVPRGIVFCQLIDHSISIA